MPNRIVRADLLRSERYHEVSETARLLFLELLLTADDYGLVHLAPVVLRMSCPVAGGRSSEQMAKILTELNDVDLVRVYEVNGARYGFVPRFGNWPKARKPKHPLPTDETSLKEINDLVSKRQSRFYPDAVHRDYIGTAAGLPPDCIGTTEMTPLPLPLPITDNREEKARDGKTAPAGAQARGSRFGLSALPDDWRAYCAAARPDLDPVAVFDDFRDFWIAKPGQGGVKLDWLATWRGWVRRQKAGDHRGRGIGSPAWEGAR